MLNWEQFFKDDKGKAIYTNETMREAVFFTASHESQDWQTVQEKLIENKDQAGRLEARLERLRNEHRTALALLAYETAALSLDAA
jgi:hypothetical protein